MLCLQDTFHYAMVQLYAPREGSIALLYLFLFEVLPLQRFFTSACPSLSPLTPTLLVKLNQLFLLVHPTLSVNRWLSPQPTHSKPAFQKQQQLCRSLTIHRRRQQQQLSWACSCNEGGPSTASISGRSSSRCRGSGGCSRRWRQERANTCGEEGHPGTTAPCQGAGQGAGGWWW